MDQDKMKACGLKIIELITEEYKLTYQEAFFLLAATTESLLETQKGVQNGN